MRKDGKCCCRLCIEDSPMLKSFEAKLTKEESDWLNKLYARVMVAEDDNGYYQACLSGEWPGWEWMVKAKEENSK